MVDTEKGVQMVNSSEEQVDPLLSSVSAQGSGGVVRVQGHTGVLLSKSRFPLWIETVFTKNRVPLYSSSPGLI